MQYQQYDTYKNSGLQWLEKVPQHWEVKKGKWIWKKENRPVRADDDVITAFRDGMVTLRKNRREDGFTNSVLEIGYQGIRKNDLVIHGMDAFAGAIGVSDSDGKSTPVYSACTPINNANPHYFKYLLQAMSKTGYIEALARGIRERSTEFKFPQFSNLKYPEPPVEEQKAIAEFLDKKTSQIDAHIDKQERLIALLKERRTAIINKAVTRGLDENVKLKDSGVDWLGEIPEHWEVKKIKHFSYTKGRIGFHGLKSDEFLYDSGAYLITGTDFMDGTINWNSCRRVTEKRYKEDENIHIRNNDLLITKDGTIGKTAIVTNMPYKTTLNSGVLLVRTQQTICQTRYLFWIVNSYIFKRFIDLKNAGTTIKHLYQNDFNNFWVSLPSLREQEEIINFCNQEDDKTKKAIETIEQEIATLKEYRQSLISNAVTGKIKVI